MLQLLNREISSEYRKNEDAQNAQNEEPGQPVAGQRIIDNADAFV